MRYRVLLTGLFLTVSFGLVGCNSNPTAPTAPSASSVPAGDGTEATTAPGEIPTKKGGTAASPLTER